MKVVTVDEMQHIEAASDAAGHSYAAMMERAGQAVAQAILSRRGVQGRQTVVLVGPGNNGGDGLVAARHLADADALVACYLAKPRDSAQDENFWLIQERGLDIAFAGEEDEQEWTRLRHLVRNADVLIDALLGTGTTLPVRGTIGKMLDVAKQALETRQCPSPESLTSLSNRSSLAKHNRPFVVAVDGPSGMDYDSGGLDELAIPADLTVTFAYPKVGHFRFPAASALGELVVADIGTDPVLADDVSLEVITPAMVRSWLPPHPPDAHKGTFGRALIAAGSTNYTGAAYLAGAAATRAGAGLVTLALPAAIHPAVAARLAEATYLLLPHELGVIAASAASVLTERTEAYDAMLLGPGLGQERTTVAFIEELLSGAGKRRRIGFGSTDASPITSFALPPLVIDADGLNILANIENWPERIPPASILTPHPGEMARLMESSTKDVQAERVAVARSQATAWNQVIVLKGAHTIVAAPDGRTVIEPFANAGLATAGTGDVLAGTIVALRAQGLGAFEAAAAGAYLHGLAGELARGEIGTAGMVAGDVLAHLPQALKNILGE